MVPGIFLKLQEVAWRRLDSLASSRTFLACSCRNRTWNRGQRVRARCWTVLHLLEPFVVALARTAPGKGVKEYMQDAGQYCIFQNLPCLLLQEPHLEQGSENTCRRLDNLASYKPSVPAPAGTAPGTGVREYMQDAGKSFIF
jgi:hypothetical protein